MNRRALLLSGVAVCGALQQLASQELAYLVKQTKYAVFRITSG